MTQRQKIYGKSPKPKPLKSKTTAVADRRELKFYGTAACLALWQQRPGDIIRIYIRQDLVNAFAPLLKWAAEQRKAYHIVKDDDLERLAESIHHQGICVLAKEHERYSFVWLKSQLRDTHQGVLMIYLDGVENPHNLGAIIRSSAHFGVLYVLGAVGQLPRISPSACRVAEGGAEHVKLIFLNHPLEQLSELKTAGFQLVSSNANGADLYAHEFNSRTVLIMGAELTGVSRSIQSAADKTLAIPGSGAVESVNVAAAFAVFAGEYYRQQHFQKIAK